ncbi:MAG: hypothetical protein CMA56_03815 [Euryarchaeota archaeon]|nr:hypothetical protein [Euryarchaeota archaeon]
MQHGRSHLQQHPILILTEMDMTMELTDSQMTRQSGTIRTMTESETTVTNSQTTQLNPGIQMLMVRVTIPILFQQMRVSGKTEMEMVLVTIARALIRITAQTAQTPTLTLTAAR